MIKKTLIVVFVCLVLIFALRDRALRFFITYLLKDKLNGEASLKEAHSSFSGIVLEDLEFSTEDFSVKLGRGNIAFAPLWPGPPGLSGVFLEDVDIRIIDINNTRRLIQEKFVRDIGRADDRGFKKGGPPVLDLNLKNVSIKYKDMEIKDISAVLDFSGYPRICLRSSLRSFSFEDVIVFMGAEEDVFFKGLFDGELTVCLEGGRLEYIKGALYNNREGSIHIRRDAPLDFLKRRMSQRSYDLLVDNLKNYNYNKGIVEIAKEADRITVRMDFDSEEMGKREITINLFNILGGAR